MKGPLIITPAYLRQVYIRALDETDGRYKSVNCRDCTDKQFDTWAKSRMPIQGPDNPWPLDERAEFCDLLYQSGGLYILLDDSGEEAISD